MDGQGSLNLNQYIDPQYEYKVHKQYPESANDLSLCNIIRHCLEADCNDNPINNQQHERECNLNMAFRALLDDVVLSTWYLHLFNQSEKIKDKEIPVWKDNIAFFRSENKYNTK